MFWWFLRRTDKPLSTGGIFLLLPPSQYFFSLWDVVERTRGLARVCKSPVDTTLSGSTMKSHQKTWPTIGCSNHPHVFFLSIWSPCRDVSAVQQHHRLLLCIARQNDDSWPWWRRRAYGYRCKCNDLDQPASMIMPVKEIPSRLISSISS